MNANIMFEEDVMIVQLSGILDFDKAFEFRQKSMQHLLEKKVVFSLKELSFIGSTGMSSFVETIAELAQKNPNGVRICNVGLEYKRLLEPYFNEKLQIFADIEQAKKIL